MDVFESDDESSVPSDERERDARPWHQRALQACQDTLDDLYLCGLSGERTSLQASD